MNIDSLLKQVNLFYRLASGETEAVLKKLSELETFKDRVDYAEDKLEHLSSGSSRVIYVLPGEKKVLKLAKNERGVAQNKAESNPKMKSKYITKTLRSDKNGYWKISEYLDKITAKEFEKMTGVDFDDFGEALRYGLKSVSDNDAKKPKNFSEIEKLDMYKDLIKLGKEFELMPGDMARISSWGKIDDHPLLLDAGLTKDIYDEFYDSSS